MKAKPIPDPAVVQEALELAARLVVLARRHFPKSVHVSDRFHLEQTSAAISKALEALK